MIALDPDKTFWLPLSKDKPAALKCRFASCRQIEEYEDALDAAAELRSDREAITAVLAALDKLVAGARDIEGDWKEHLRNVMTRMEIWRFAGSYITASTNTEADLKNFASASPTAGALAETAPAVAK
jgi:hypothetical protein